MGFKFTYNASNTRVGNIVVIDNFNVPQLDTSRRIWVYLPPDYYLKPANRYPVLYMNDGQNLFDNDTSFVGEWQIDQTLEKLFKEQKTKGVIVVGIDNGGDERLNEYSPWNVNKFGRIGGGKGDKYSDFIVHTLKPYINKNFRTKKELTGIGGSSLGALISVYVGLKNQHVFSRIACFSPAFWIAKNEAENFVMKTEIINKELKVYIDAGTNEAEDQTLRDAYPEDAQHFSKIISNKGASVNLVIDSEYGFHNEHAWARRFPNAFLWLY